MMQIIDHCQDIISEEYERKKKQVTYVLALFQ